MDLASGSYISKYVRKTDLVLYFIASFVWPNNTTKKKVRIVRPTLSLIIIASENINYK